MRTLLPTLALALLLAACHSDSGDAPDASQPLALSIAGCSELRQDGTCELGPARELVGFVPSTQEPVRVELDGRTLAVHTVSIAGGLQLVLSLPTQATTLTLHSDGRTTNLRLAPHSDSAPLTEARALLAAGKLDDALDRARDLEQSRDPITAARAASLRGRILMQRGRFDETLTCLSAAAAAHERLGLLRSAALDHLALAHVLQHQKQASQRALDELNRVSEHLPLERALAQRQRAAIRFLSGDLRGGLHLAREAKQWGKRLAHPGLITLATELELMQLAEIGRIEDARALSTELEAQPGRDDCGRARLAANMGWIELVSERGDVIRGERESGRAAQLYTESCPDSAGRQNALINLALAKEHQGDVAQARVELDRALALGAARGWVRAWADELAARLTLLAGRASEARELYLTLVQRAQAAAIVSAEFRAALGLAKAELALGHADAAALSLEAAELALERDVRAIPLSEGRDVFAGDRDESARLLIATYLRLGRRADALAAARRARARALRVLAVRDQLSKLTDHQRAELDTRLATYRDTRRASLVAEQRAWSLPTSELAAFRASQAEVQARADAALDLALAEVLPPHPFAARPPEDAEAILIAHPLPEGWAVFLQDRAATHVVTLPALPLAPTSETAAQAWSTALLEPFFDALRHARQLRVLPYGLLKDVDVHALPWRGGLVAETWAVVYGTDLGVDVSPTAVSSAHSARALILADPGGDLPHARDEAQLIRRALAHGPSTVVLESSVASHARALSLLPSNDLFYYAGHAERDASGQKSSLRLAGGELLTPSDVLALPRVPLWVVLSGCETMRERDDVAVASLGLAQAFVSRGAQVVVATTRPVPDALGVALARELTHAGTLSLEPWALTRALLALRKDAHGASAWSSYRVLVP
jgi:tetratricopeptide (TPR) repeat protein